ncbi:hypothetical protein WISP_29059 [Willisornis vidua]|uniref:Uncharacterized protein n=1 Tax=Willisornis vidua TaxID=1566151 RepID=A0ABQ9DLD1_9PASS|nr:hypothetical protein WISP_29059 [Willisornis vidua]
MFTQRRLVAGTLYCDIMRVLKASEGKVLELGWDWTTSSAIKGAIQLGIGYTVGNLTSKPDRDVLMQDFYVVESVFLPSYFLSFYYTLDILIAKQRGSLLTIKLGDSDDKVENLQVRIKGMPNKADILVGACYKSPNQDEEVDELFCKQLVDVS